MRPIKPTDEEISDYIDGVLDAERQAEIAAWLEQNPGEAAAVERQRQLNEALQNLGADILREPVPPRLHEVLRRHARPEPEPAESENAAPAAVPEAPDPPPPAEASPSRHRHWLGRVAVALLLLALGAIGGWLARSALLPTIDPMDALLADATYAFTFYSEDRDYAIQFQPDDIERFREVSMRVFERTVSPPDLAEIGYRFRGARIAPTGSRTSTFFFFEGEGGSDLSVIFWSQVDQPPGPPGFRALDDVFARYWFVQGLGFAVLGHGDEASLRQISEQVLAFYENNLS